MTVPFGTWLRAVTPCPSCEIPLTVRVCRYIATGPDWTFTVRWAFRCTVCGASGDAEPD